MMDDADDNGESHDTKQYGVTHLATEHFLLTSNSKFRPVG